MGDTDNLIQLVDLIKIFRTERREEICALKLNNLGVKENDFICIVGPSGCGKSTLLRIIAGLETATSGTVLYKGCPQNKPSREIGMVFQEYSLLPWLTVTENIVLGLGFRNVSSNLKQQTSEKFLKLINMEDFRNAYPSELSGGMQQRVAIARALANEPDIILMDEPFGALDAYTRVLMQKELLKIWDAYKKTVLFVTHSVDEAIYLASKIIVMSSRPGSIKEIIDVGMPWPRDRANPRYGELSNHIFKMLDFAVASQTKKSLFGGLPPKWVTKAGL